MQFRWRWVVEDGTVGGIVLRFGTHDFIRVAGHIGYGIRPSARGRGLATWALGQMLNLARDVGQNRVLLVCEADNPASAAKIEHNGGVLESSPDAAAGAVRRYWIAVDGPAID